MSDGRKWNLIQISCLNLNNTQSRIPVVDAWANSESEVPRFVAGTFSNTSLYFTS